VRLARVEGVPAAGVVAMQGAHHGLELADLLTRRTGGRIGGVRREIAERVISPVVGEPGFEQVWLVDEVVHRHEFDSRHAERGEMVDDRRMGESRIGAAKRGRHVRMLGGKAPDVEFIEHRIGPRCAEYAVFAPGKIVTHDDRVRHVGGTVEIVVVVAARVVVEPSRQCPRIGVDEQFRGVPPQTLTRVVPTAHPEPIALPRTQPGHISVPDVIGLFHQRHPLRLR